MRETRITLPELALIAGTRAALGAGLGLLLGDRLPQDQRRVVGWTLFLVGVISTVPIAFEILGGLSPIAGEEWPEQAISDPGSRSDGRRSRRSAPAPI
jgi:hypothetical protein